MEISFIIPAHNEEINIGPCLDSVIKNTRGHYTEIIVIDNASSDHTAEVAKKKYGVRVIEEKRKGLGHAREAGRLAAVGDYLAYIDADCRLPEGWIDTAEREFRIHSDAVCLSGPPLYFDTSVFQTMLLHSLWWTTAPVAYRMIGYMVYGANFIAKKSALNAIGGFDRSIEFYGEDTDIARRLSTTGKVLFRMHFPIFASARRFREEGLFKTSAVYALNYLWPVFFRRPFSLHYRDVR
jgi:glycosyltransferase involved in cell wall biosynthesis